MSDLGYPFVQARASNYSSGRQGYSIIWIIVHCTDQGYADSYPQNLGTYWAREDTQVSVHYGVSDTQTYQYVAHADTAYQARNPGNLRGIGIEFSGQSSYNRATWDSHDAMLRRGGQLIAQIGAKHGIPLHYLSDAELNARQPGITTHAQLTRVFGGTHTDPGSGFPLDTLLAYANGEDDMPSLDEIRTVIREEIKTYFEVPRGWWNEADGKPLIEKLYATEHRSGVLLDAAGEVKDKLDEVKAGVDSVQVGGVDVAALAATLSPQVSKAVNDELYRRQEK